MQFCTKPQIQVYVFAGKHAVPQFGTAISSQRYGVTEQERAHTGKAERRVRSNAPSQKPPNPAATANKKGDGLCFNPMAPGMVNVEPPYSMH